MEELTNGRFNGWTGGLTQIRDRANVARDLLPRVLPKATQEVDDEVDGSLAGLWVNEDKFVNMSTKDERDGLTGMSGSRGSTADSSRRAWGSKNNLNHSHFEVPAMGLAFLASRPHAMTWPISSYNKHVGICTGAGCHDKHRTTMKRPVGELPTHLSEVLERPRPSEDLLYLSAGNTGGAISL